MRFVISKAAFARLLSVTTKAVEPRNTIPILSNVLLETNADGISVTATDLDVIVRATEPASGLLENEAGAVTVQAATLAAIVSRASGSEITAWMDGEQMHVQSGRASFNLPTLPATDFPSVDADSYETTFTVDLAALFAPVKFAISTEETRYYLNGVYLLPVDGMLTAVCTDGHRLALERIPCGAKFAGVIVPRKAVGLVPAGEIEVSVSERTILFKSEGLQVTSKLIDGTFPDYTRVIPINNDKNMTVDGEKLAKAVDLVTTVASDRGRAVKFSLTANDLALSVNNPDEGNAKESLSVEYSAEPMDIGFNGKYIADLVRSVGSGEVKFKFTDAGAPALIPTDNGLRVCMPMRVA